MKKSLLIFLFVRRSFLLLSGFLLVLNFSFQPDAFAVEEAALLTQGDNLYDSRDEVDHAEAAISIYKKVLEVNPKSDAALWRLSRSFKWKGDTASLRDDKLAAYHEGEKWAKEAVEFDAESVGGHLMLGIAYGRIGETQGVMKSLSLISQIKKEMNAVLAKDPQNDVAHHVLGVLFRKVPRLFGGSMAKSIEELKIAVSVNPFSTVHHLELAKSYLEEGEQDRGVEELRALLAISTPSDRVQSKRDRAEAERLLFQSVSK